MPGAVCAAEHSHSRETSVWDCYGSKPRLRAAAGAADALSPVGSTDGSRQRRRAPSALQAAHAALYFPRGPSSSPVRGTDMKRPGPAVRPGRGLLAAKILVNH